MTLYQLFDETDRCIASRRDDFDGLKQRGLDELARRPEGQFRIEMMGGDVSPLVLTSRLDGETRTWSVPG